MDPKLKLSKKPPIMKVYEALSVLADKRIHLSGTTATVDSSKGNKVYEVVYDPEGNTIVASDSGSFWQRYVSYPSITLLLSPNYQSTKKQREYK